MFKSKIIALLEVLFEVRSSLGVIASSFSFVDSGFGVAIVAATFLVGAESFRGVASALSMGAESLGASFG